MSVLRSIDKGLQEIERELMKFKQHVETEKKNVCEAKVCNVSVCCWLSLISLLTDKTQTVALM